MDEFPKGLSTTGWKTDAALQVNVIRNLLRRESSVKRFSLCKVLAARTHEAFVGQSFESVTTSFQSNDLLLDKIRS